MPTPALAYKDVVKRFKENNYDSVAGVSLEIMEGEFVTILGTSGSGKTTLLKMANRIHEITAGTIEFFGQDIATLDVNQYRRQIGYVIQQGGLFPHKTVEENIATVPKLLKWDKERTKKRVRELMDLVQLEYDTYRKRYPKSLSGGQQQRVGIARALAAQPRVMLMDEPFGAIDAITRSVLQKEIRRLHQQLGNTILFVTHDVLEAFTLGQRVIIMDQGKVQQFDTPYHIMQHPANDFVRRLISAGDGFDKLKALEVTGDLLPAPPSLEGARISKECHLNDALLQMLRLDTHSLLVEGEDGQVVGQITMDQIKALLGK